jgi:hypothetical protein
MKTSALLGAILFMGLTACGGSDHDGHPQTPPVQPPPPVAGDAPDAFVVQVAGVAAAAPDDAEPAALDASAPTMPDNTEPAALAP